jgi:hypothetical protein
MCDSRIIKLKVFIHSYCIALGVSDDHDLDFQHVGFCTNYSRMRCTVKMIEQALLMVDCYIVLHIASEEYINDE